MEELKNWLETNEIEFTKNFIGNIEINNKGESIIVSYHGVDGYRIEVNNEFGEFDYKSNIENVKAIIENLAKLFI